MTEKEKEAIETLEIEGTKNNYLEVRILLDLVEKQQKEIKNLKDENDFLKQMYSGTEEFKAISKLAESGIL